MFCSLSCDFFSAGEKIAAGNLNMKLYYYLKQMAGLNLLNVW